MAYFTAVLNTETAGVCTTTLELTTETVITLDVKLKTGTHDNSRVTLHHSPDGTNWFTSGQSTNGTGSTTDVISTRFVKACVFRGEGSVATADIFITAK